MTTDAKRILFASPRGFCAGVRHAVEMMDTVLGCCSLPIYCLKELVHNRQVVEALERRGVRFVADIHDIPEGGRAVFSAHGVSPEIRHIARQRGLQVFDATCPYVTRLHTAVRRYVRQDCHVLLIGNRDHDEVIGVRGEAPDRVTVIGDIHEAATVSVADPGKVAAITQTTLDAAATQPILNFLARRFPALRTAPRSHICFATHHRQKAARDVAQKVDLMLVLGSENSSNTNRLVEVCRKEGTRTVLIRAEADIAPIDFEPITVVGLTAGASTPHEFERRMVDTLRQKGFTDLREHVAVEEKVHFPMPRRLRIMAETMPPSA